MIAGWIKILNGINKVGFFIFILAVLLGMGFSRAEAQEGPLKLAIGKNSLSGPQEPIDRVFRIRADYPQTLAVIVTNISSSSQSFYEQASGGGLSSIYFEISDENSNTNVVRRKKQSNASSAVVSTYMNPGEERVFEIVLNETAWDGSFKLYKQGSRKFKVRAVYDNDNKKIYSPYYDLIVTSREDVESTASSAETQTSGVLVSQ